MAIQCRNQDGRPERIEDIGRFGFTETPQFVYEIDRTNEDGTPFESKLF